MKISTNDPRHQSLEHEIIRYVSQIGGVTVRAGYHDIWPQDIVESLRRLDDSTSTYIRTRKDFVAIFKGTGSLLIDAKTTPRSLHAEDKNDLCIELTPLATAIIMRCLGVKTLFCCQFSDHTCGFIAGKPVAQLVDAVMFPRFRHDDNVVLEYKKRFGWMFSGAQFISCGGGGSGDPYCRISKVHVLQMPQWQQLLFQHAISSNQGDES